LFDLKGYNDKHLVI